MERVYKMEEAAKILRITRRSLDTLVRKPGGPRIFRVGGSIRITHAELEAWIESRLETVKGEV